MTTTATRKNTWEGSSEADLWLKLRGLSDEVVEHFKTDLYHDAVWVEKHCVGAEAGTTVDFWFATRKCGTSIGADRKVVAYINHVGLYRCQWRQPIVDAVQVGTWTVTRSR